MTTIRYALLCIPTALLMLLSACAGQLIPGQTQGTAAVSSIDAIGETGETRVRFEDGVVVSIKPGRRVDDKGARLANPTDLEAVSSDGTTASLEEYKGLPVVRFGALRGALFMSDGAKAELSKWQARGNTAAFALVSVVTTNTAAVAGVPVTELVSPYRAAALAGGNLRTSQAACAVAVEDQPEVFDFPEEECRLQPGDETLVGIAHSGWYPCVRDAILALITALGTYWLCGACITFLWSAIPGILGYASNPIGWVAALLGSASCVACAASAWGQFTSTRDAIINCFNSFANP